MDYGARFYDPAIGRWHVIDAMAEQPYNWPLTPYHYTNNNPILYVDINGEDWFVNGENGNVLYVKGVSELNEDQVKMYGEGWANFGADDMFGDEVLMEGQDGEMENILDKNDYEFGPTGGEEFMNKQGYEKGERSQMEHTEFETTIYDDATLGGRTIRNSSEVPIGDSEITYAKPDNFGKRENVTTDKYRDDNMTYFKENYSVVNKPGTIVKQKYISPAQVIKDLLGIGGNISSN